MMRVELCDPQFPPVSISMGIKDTRRGTAANASSYRVMMVPVMVADSIRKRSHAKRFLHVLARKSQIEVIGFHGLPDWSGVDSSVYDSVVFKINVLLIKIPSFF